VIGAVSLKTVATSRFVRLLQMTAATRRLMRSVHLSHAVTTDGMMFSGEGRLNQTKQLQHQNSHQHQNHKGLRAMRIKMVSAGLKHVGFVN
jgi:hypothetical protein